MDHNRTGGAAAFRRKEDPRADARPGEGCEKFQGTTKTKFGEIIKNNIGDYKPKVKKERIIPVISEEHYETKFKVKTRSGFEDLEEEFDE